MRAWTARLLLGAVAAVTVLACRVPNEAHCGRQAGDATCAARDPMTPYCSLCEAENDGCIASVAEISAECRPSGAELGDETADEIGDETGDETGDTGTSSETSESDTESTDAESTDATTDTGEPECGNGIKEDGEDCDGMDFGDASCADPYQLPEGELTCVPGACVIDTSTCCLGMGAVCEPGECCGQPCGAVTNECGGL